MLAAASIARTNRRPATGEFHLVDDRPGIPVTDHGHHLRWTSSGINSLWKILGRKQLPGFERFGLERPTGRFSISVCQPCFWRGLRPDEQAIPEASHGVT